MIERQSGLVLPGERGFQIPDRRDVRERQRQADRRHFREFGPDEELLRQLGIHPMQGGAQHPTYLTYNSAMATTAAPVKQPTGTAIRTMMQLKPATGVVMIPIAWGISFDGSAAAVGGEVELVETDVAATSLTTAFAAADVQLYGDPNADANTAGTGGVPLNLGTSASGFSTAAVTEGSTTNTRMADLQIIQPTTQYTVQWPLGREFAVKEQRFFRVRVTFGASVNMYVWVLFEV